MGYPTQFSMSGKLNKGDIEYHISILHDERKFNWYKIELRYQDEPITFPFAVQVSLLEKI